MGPESYINAFLHSSNYLDEIIVTSHCVISVSYEWELLVMFCLQWLMI